VTYLAKKKAKKEAEASQAAQTSEQKKA